MGLENQNTVTLGDNENLYMDLWDYYWDLRYYWRENEDITSSDVIKKMLDDTGVLVYNDPGSKRPHLRLGIMDRDKLMIWRMSH